MSRWLYECINDHPSCSHPDISFRPSRLLDVKAFEGCQDLRLVLSEGQITHAPDHDNGSSLPSITYVALSHCWGPPAKRPVLTTISTLAQHMRRITFSDLSLTFKDAVELTIKLGQRYLWVDSLCIIQDDTEDWLQEASKMSQVYRNAILTLSALSSADSTQGCRVAPTQHSTTGHRHFDLEFGRGRIRVYESHPENWDDEYGFDLDNRVNFVRNPLRGRGWALQERELSARSVLFSRNSILWECRTCKRNSDQPWEDFEGISSYRLPIPNSPTEDDPWDEPMDSRNRWYMIMEDYMTRDLTYDSDKLPALSGLAQWFQTHKSAGRYLAGLWSEHLPYCLLWRTMDPTEYAPALHPPSYRAPTWSFLALDTPISYESQQVQGDGYVEAIFNEPSPKCATVCNTHVELCGQEALGAIRSAKLDMRGSVISLRLASANKERVVGRSRTTKMWLALEISEGTVAGKLYLDCVQHFHENTLIWCIAIRPEDELSVECYAYIWSDGPEGVNDVDSTDGLVMGLILDKVDDQENTYRRIGMIRWMKESLFDDVPISDFTLI